MPFNIYADFECIVKELKVLIGVIGMMMLHTLKNFGNIFLAVLPITLFVLMINLVKQLFFAEEKMHSINLLKQS